MTIYEVNSAGWDVPGLWGGQHQGARRRWEGPSGAPGGADKRHSTSSGLGPGFFLILHLLLLLLLLSGPGARARGKPPRSRNGKGRAVAVRRRGRCRGERGCGGPRGSAWCGGASSCFLNASRGAPLFRPLFHVWVSPFGSCLAAAAVPAFLCVLGSRASEPGPCFRRVRTGNGQSRAAMRVPRRTRTARSRPRLRCSAPLRAKRAGPSTPAPKPGRLLSREKLLR